MPENISDDMMRLLFVIYEYTRTTNQGRLEWIKELPVMAIIYEGILRGLFKTYDYAPWSVQMLDGTRRWLNVSREGKDDIIDLLNLRYISVLRLSTSQYGFITAYRLTELGVSKIDTISKTIKDEIQALICGDCDFARKVIVKKNKFYFHNEETGEDVPITIDEVEDVPYTTRPYLPDSLLPSKSTEGGQ